jgi:hypothetical protein
MVDFILITLDIISEEESYHQKNTLHLCNTYVHIYNQCAHLQQIHQWGNYMSKRQNSSSWKFRSDNLAKKLTVFSLLSLFQ